MPRSLPRRIESLERQQLAQPRARGSEWLLSETERWAARGWPGCDDAIRQSWAAYVAARDQVEASAPSPPASYRPELPEPRRTRLWQRWHHPELDEAVDGLLKVIIAHASA